MTGRRPIGGRAFDILVALIEQRERLVGKNELLDLVWPDSIVEQGNLQVHIFSLRKLLSAAAIATIPGRGYQFVAPVEGNEPQNSAPQSNVKIGNSSLHPMTLYGPDLDLSTLKTLIVRNQLVSLVGPGGIGKTCLARAAVQEWSGVERERVWVVELAAIDKAYLVV